MARKMKDSGIDWIGEIPEGWRTINPKALFTQRKDKAQKGERQLTSSQQYGILYQDDYMELTGSKVVTVEKDFDILKHVEAGDFVISMRSFQGGLEYSTKSGAISSAYVMLVPNLELVYPRFYRWLLKSSVYIDALQRTTNMVRDGQAMRYSNFAQVRLFTLSIDEQKSRADFLDTKCSSIDKILSKTRSSIEEYKTLKQAIITQAVTTGVHGEREMKNSKIEWVGNIPIDWNTIKLKYCTYIRARLGWKALKADEYVEIGFPFLSAFNIVSNTLQFTNLNYINQFRYDESPEIQLSNGDVLLVKDGAGIGKCAIVENMPMPSTVNGSIAVISVTNSLIPKYLYYYFLSKMFQQHIDLLKDGMGVPHLFQSDLKEIKIAFPSKDEQKEIADYLDGKCAEIDKLIAKKEQLVKELENYKKSLIYEVVTGKREV